MNLNYFKQLNFYQAFLPKREDLEKTSKRFAVKYLLGIMNSKVAHNFLRAHRRSNIHLYPDDWKQLPIPDVSTEQQIPIIQIVDQILAAKQQHPAADIRALEAELDRLASALYGLTPEEIAIVEGPARIKRTSRTSGTGPARDCP